MKVDWLITALKLLLYREKLLPSISLCPFPVYKDGKFPPLTNLDVAKSGWSFEVKILVLLCTVNVCPKTQSNLFAHRSNKN